MANYNSIYTGAEVDSALGKANTALQPNTEISVNNITTTGYIRGPSTFVIDPAVHGDSSGTLTILGNLQVDGTTTTINSTTVEVDDKNIVLANGAINASAADGAGITVDGASATLIYNSIPDAWSFNKNVGIGTNAPDNNLHIQTNSGDEGILIKSTGDTSNAIVADANRSSAGAALVALQGKWNGTAVADILLLTGTDTSNKDDGVISFRTSSADNITERVRIDASGKLLVGKNSSSITTAGTEITSSSLLQSVSDTSTNLATNGGAVLNLCNTSATDGNFSNIGGYNSNGLVVSQMNFINLNHASRTGAITFSTHNGSSMPERMRIDASGNVLVGKDTTAIETVGIDFLATGRIIATADGDDVAVFNRKTSDGDIAVFKKDGITAGSIGVASGPVSYIVLNNTVTDNVAGLKGASGAILPSTSTGADKDGTMDLGSSGARFENLYLSGDVIQGSTAAGFINFNTGQQTVSTGQSVQTNLFDRTTTGTAATGTVYVACENSGQDVLFGYIIDFFYSNSTLTTTARETGNSQGTTTCTVQENGTAISVTVDYVGGLGGNIRFNAGGQASVFNYT